MDSLRRFLVAMRWHKAWAWLGVCVYACAVTFPHQQVEDLVEIISNRISRPRLYQYSATIAVIEAAVLMLLIVRLLRGQETSRWLLAYWLLSLALITATWGMFTANNTELVHYPQYFPEGVALLALTLSPAESLAWIVVFGGLDEAFQYAFLRQGRPLPFDFNDVYMDLGGGAAGVVFAMAVLRCGRKTEAASVLKRPGVVVLLSIVAAGIALWASGKMALDEAPGSPSHWFSLSRLKTPTFWYFNPNFFGPHHFHELSPIEGPILILATIALYGLLDRTLKISSVSRREFVRDIFAGSAVSLAFGKTPASIWLSPEASLSEKWAAEQLSVHLGLPVVISEQYPKSPAILVGRTAAVDKYRLEIPEGESCLLKTVGANLIIAGGRQRGTMYGVFCFLEKLGCRWFTADIARIPRLRALSIPRLDEIIRPAFEYREVFFTEAQGKEWSAKNRLNGHFHQLDETVGGKISYLPFAHSFYELVPPDQYFGTHPEYFALVSGKRRRENAQLCLTNADVARITTERIQQWLTKHPDVSIVSVSQNDSAGWCECDPCQQVVKNEGGAVSGLLLRFVNQIARVYPDKTIDTLAYQETEDPPAMVKALPNVQIRFCPIDACQAHSYQTCVYNNRVKEQLSQWSRITPKLVVWQYSINFSHFLLPFPNEAGLISDIRQFRRTGISGVFVEGAVSDGGGGENAELRAYLAARLLWNPEIDVNAEIQGFLNAVYGQAAPLMWRYYALRQRDIGPSEHLWIDQNVDAPYLTDRYLQDGRNLLNRAILKAENGPARRRIERSLLSFDYIETMRARRCGFHGGFYAPRPKPETQAFIQKAEALGITNLREGYPIADQARDLDELGKAYSVITLDDGVLAVKIVPDLGARIVALGPSGSGVNVLRVPDPGEWAYPNAGGVYFSLGHRLNWRSGPATQRAVTLSGQSERGLDLNLEISLDGGVLRMRITVANRTPSPLPTVLHCQAELAFPPSRKAVLKYTARSGTEVTRSIFVDGSVLLEDHDLPRQEWSALQVQNRFRAQDVARCTAQWSFRGTPGLNMGLWSPDVVLASGQKISLESQYQLI